MKTDTEIRINGFEILVKELGTVEAERFIALIMREPFDYTKWQSDLWADQGIDEISRKAMSARKKTELTTKQTEPGENQLQGSTKN